MLTNERQNIILQLLEAHHTIKIQDIIQATNASESTVRRDLTELESKQQLVRIHGGATKEERRMNEFSMDEKSSKNIQDKKRIAHTAASLVYDRECIYLDAGTTTLQMIPLLKDKDITIVTNGLNHGVLLMELGIPTYFTGGLIKSKTGALIGAKALESIEGYRFDKCFLGVNGFDIHAGFTTPDPEEASLKRAAQSAATETIVLADREKYNQVTFAHINDIDTATIITCDLETSSRKELEKVTNMKDVKK